MKKYFVCAFLSLASFSYAMDYPPMEYRPITYPPMIPVMPYEVPKCATMPMRFADDMPDDRDYTLLDLSEFECVPTEERKKLHQLALAYAPEEIESIFKEGEEFSDLLRSNRLILYGPVGSGKSTLAEAMACCRGRSFIIPSTRIITDRRSVTRARLNDVFNQLAALEQGKKTLVIDDINVLAESYRKQYADTDDSLCANLDQFKLDDFLLIGTAADLKQLPLELQDQFMQKVVAMKGNHYTSELIWGPSKPISGEERRHQERLKQQRELHEERLRQQQERLKQQKALYEQQKRLQEGQLEQQGANERSEEQIENPGPIGSFFRGLLSGWGDAAKVTIPDTFGSVEKEKE